MLGTASVGAVASNRLHADDKRRSMKIESGKLYAVLTGDIVSFSKLPKGDRASIHRILQEGTETFQKAFKGSIPLKVDVFRGDSWQLLVADTSLALRAALFLRAYLCASIETAKVDTRIALGIGTIDFVPDGRVSRGDGAAYRISGSGLERMNKASRMSFGFLDNSAEGALDIIVRLVDAIVIKLSARQARALTGALQGLTQERIGSLWKPPITQQTVNRHLQRAGWFAVEGAIRFFEEQLKKAVTL
jgi:hypothetical protein